MKSLSRALTLLSELSKHDHAVTLAELSDTVGLHKSTAHRMLATFVEHGLVRRDEARRYVLNLQQLKLAQVGHDQRVHSAVVRNALLSLRDKTGQITHYAVPDGLQLYCVANLSSDPSHHVGAMPTVDSHLEMYSTALGRAYLAYRPRAEVERYLALAPFRPRTPLTVTDAHGIIRALGQVRRHGYAFEDCEDHADIRSVGAAVLDQQGMAVAAVGISSPADHCQRAGLPQLAAAVTACAADIGYGLSTEANGQRNVRSVASNAGRAVQCLPT